MESSLRTGKREFDGVISSRVAFDEADHAFFKNFVITAAYHLKPPTTGEQFLLTLAKGDRQLQIRVSEGPVLTVSFGDVTFREILLFLVRLVDPDLDEFELDEPWDTLLSVALQNLQLSIGKRGQSWEAGFSVACETPELLQPFLKIGAIGLKYQTGKVKIILTGTFLNITFSESKPLEWDPINEAPPTVPGQGRSKLDLRYLALGQRVSLQSLAGKNDIKSVMQALRDGVKALEPADRSKSPITSASALKFDAKSNWLITAEFSAAETLDLRVIFNDPNVYGIRIELSGQKAKKFAGLQFEILYRRISETIGVYHTELVLPDIMRFLEFGAVSVTLPIIVLDIYTNGDFKLDVGFPWNGNFDRSFAVQVLPFTGAGGFYFNKLSAETVADSNTKLPTLKPGEGNFSPILAFGVGVRIGLGKSFNKGPLKAELSIVVQGILEGVIAFYNPVSAPTQGTYYMVQGAISIVGRVYGSVDFEIIRIDVEVVARITIQFRVECYKPIVVKLTAEVSVRASITIILITINFSFSLSISQTFEIPALESGSPPWVAAIQGGSGENLNQLSVTGRETKALIWEPVQLWDSPVEIELLFHLVFTRVDQSRKAVALLLMENSIPADAVGRSQHAASAASTETDFDKLAQALLAWAIYSHQLQIAATDAVSPINIGDFVVSLNDLKDLRDLLVNDQGITFDKLAAFLEQNFKFSIKPAGAHAPLSGTVFPIFPQLKVGPISAGANQEKVKKLFIDYFKLLLRTLVQEAIDVETEREAAGDATLKDLLSRLNGGGELNHLAGIASRFLLHGVRSQGQSGQFASQSMYELTGQQVNLPLGKLNEFKATLTTSQTPAETKAETRFVDLLITTIGQTQFDSFKDKILPRARTIFFIITDQSLTDLENNGVPASVRESLRQIKNQMFADEAGFVALLKTTIGEAQTGGFKSVILKRARTVSFKLTERTLKNLEEDDGVPEAVITDLSKIKDQELTESESLSAGLSFVGVLDHLLSAGELAHLNNSLGIAASFPAAPAPQDLAADLTSGFYVKQPPTFANSNSFVWGLTENKKFKVVEMSQPLRAFLRAKGASGATTLSVYRQATTEGAQPEQLQNFLLATKITVTLRRIPTASGSGYLSDTYLIGGVSDLERKLLEPLSPSDPAPFVHLLFGQTGSPYTKIADCLLAKTTTAGVSDRVATLADSAKFLSLVSESGATASAGYYLRILSQGLPETLFADGLTASLILLVTSQAVSATSTLPGETARANHNCLIIPDQTGQNDDQDDRPVMVESVIESDRVMTFAGRPGQVGFRLRRSDDSLSVVSLKSADKLKEEPNVQAKAITPTTPNSLFRITRRSADRKFVRLVSDSDTNKKGWAAVGDVNESSDPSRVLKNLYHLLAYRITSPANLGTIRNLTAGAEADLATSGQGWTYDPAGVSVGPTDNDLTHTADDGLWIYERVIPAYRLFPLPAAGSAPDAEDAELTPQNLNPYNGISESNQVSLEFRWRDIFGNESSGAAGRLDLPVRYTDPLLGIQEWPAATAQYEFAGAGATSELVIEVGFNKKLFEMANPANKVGELTKARDKYRQIFYQLDRADVEVRVTTSVNHKAALPDSKLKEDLKTFVKDAIGYLNNKLKEESNPKAPTPVQMNLVLAATAQPPSEFVFALTAQIDIIRKHDKLISDKVLEKVRQTKQATTFLAPKLPFTPPASGNGNSSSATTIHENPLTLLSAFAKQFQTAFPGLRLAISREDLSDDAGEPSTHLWAVRLSSSENSSVNYHVQKIGQTAQTAPLYFTPAPLSTTLVSGSVAIYDYAGGALLTSRPPAQKRFDAVDLNVLARQLLVGVEELLSPEIAVRLLNINSLKPSIDSIMAGKAKLVDAVAGEMSSILQPPTGTAFDPETKAELARTTFKKLLEVNLVEGYDMEAAVLVPITVSIPEALNNSFQTPPILSIHPQLKRVEETGHGTELKEPNFDLSLFLASAELKRESGYLAFLFNTQSPERCVNRTIVIDFQLSEMEYVSPEAGGRKSHLTFIPVGENSEADFYSLPLAVPLRTYPVSPALREHRAVADPDTVDHLQQIREWKYSFTYEHPDASQDAIEARVEFNTAPPAPPAQAKATTTETDAEATNPPPPSLFHALVNFAELYPVIMAELRTELKNQTLNDAAIGKIGTMLQNLAQLVSEAAEAWKNRQRQTADGSTELQGEYEIIESPTSLKNLDGTTNEFNRVTVFGPNTTKPEITVPGFLPVTGVFKTGSTIEQVFSFSRNVSPQTTTKDSAIAARTLSLPDLDIINQQNAWGAIWLTRNKTLLEKWDDNSSLSGFSGWSVSPAFRFQTPQARFGNPLNPILVNSRQWDIAAIDGVKVKGSLSAHLTKLFGTLFPEDKPINRPFDIRVACSYAFTLAESSGDKLTATHPILLSPQATLSDSTKVTQFQNTLVANLVAGITAWFNQHKPETRNAELIFSISLFSNFTIPHTTERVTNLLLKIENLRLKYEDIEPKSAVSDQRSAISDFMTADR